jgi:hypothetical protein
MLKLKDEVNFKDLLKYGFKRINVLPEYRKQILYSENSLKSIEYFIDTKTRIITIRVSGNIELLDDTIYQLTKDDLIEKVKE